MTTQPHDNQAVWFDIPCHDIDRAIAFYAAVLNCEVQKHEMSGSSMGVLPHGDAGVGGCLVEASGNSPSDHGVLLYLNCDGRLKEAVAAVEPNGGSILHRIHSIAPFGSRAVVQDSEGNRIALHSN